MGRQRIVQVAAWVTWVSCLAGSSASTLPVSQLTGVTTRPIAGATTPEAAASQPAIDRDALQSELRALRTEADYTRAAEVARSLLESCERELGSAHWDTVRAQFDLGTFARVAKLPAEKQRLQALGDRRYFDAIELLNSGKADEAARAFDEARRTYADVPSPIDSARMQVNVGIALNRTGRASEAIEQLRTAEPALKAAEHFPALAILNRELGELFCRADDCPTGVQHLLTAASLYKQLHDHNAAAHMFALAGEEYRVVLKDDELAVTAYASSLRLHDDDGARRADVQRAFAESLIRLGRKPEAIEQLEAAAQTYEEMSHIAKCDEALARICRCLPRDEDALPVHLKRLSLCEKLPSSLACARAQLDTGRCLQALGRFDDAVARLRSAVDQFAEVDDHFGTAQALTALAQSYSRLDQPELAFQAHSEALKEANASGDAEEIADAQDEIGRFLADQGRYAEAVPHLEAAVSARSLFLQQMREQEESTGSEAHASRLAGLVGLRSTQLAFTYDALGGCYTRVHEPTKALAAYQCALRLYEDPDPSRLRAGAHFQLGNLQFATEQFEEACAHYEAAREEYRSIGDPTAAAWCDHYVGDCHVGAGRLNKGVAVYLRVLAEFEVADAQPNRALAEQTSVHTGMRYFLTAAGSYVDPIGPKPDLSRGLKSMQIATKALSDATTVPCWASAVEYGRLGAQLKYNVGAWLEAEAALRQAVDVWYTCDVDQPQVALHRAIAFYELGSLVQMRNPAEAIVLLDEAARAYSTIGPECDRGRAVALVGMTYCAMMNGDLDSSMSYLQEAAVLDEPVEGLADLLQALVAADEDSDNEMNDILAQFQVLAGQMVLEDAWMLQVLVMLAEDGYAAARQTCLDVLQQPALSAGDEITVLIILAETCSVLGRHEEALSYAQQLLTKCPPVEELTETDLPAAMAAAHVYMRHPLDAQREQGLALLHRVIAVQAHIVAERARWLSSEEILSLVSIVGAVLDQYNTVLWTLQSQDGVTRHALAQRTAPGNDRILANCVILNEQRKGMAYRLLTDSQRNWNLIADDAELRATWHELMDIRSRRGQVSVAGSARVPGILESQEEALRQRARNLERKLQRTARDWGADMVSTMPRPAKAWSNAENGGTAFVSFVVTDRWDTAALASWKEAFVWVITHRSGVEQSDLATLGPAHSIASAISRWRKAVESEAAMADVHARELARVIWDPIAEAVGDAEHVIISPDGALWLVPFEALVLEDGRYLIEEKQISYVISGRYLAGQDEEESGARGAVVLAAPDYDLELAAAVSASQPALEEVRYSGALGAARFGRLEGSAREAEVLRPQLTKLLGHEEPQVLTGAVATEAAFKAVARPRVLVLSTHGFFLQDQDYSAASFADRSPLSRTLLLPPVPATTQPAVEIENPLVRCGLALAGANNRASAPPGADDGILTGLEIVGADLRGTELVVLSACETGVGEIQVGEGVAGLRQAFQLAGAQTVVSSLWKVPDAETADLMTWFFENLANGQGRSQALRNAQLRMIEQLREKRGRAHPLYWAAFTLTGKP